MKWLESKYISLLSNRLQLFKKKSGNLFNFRCPYCLDSQKNKHKARGYLYEKKGSYVFHCHNCGESKNFPRFLKDQDLGLFKEYMLEEMREKNALQPKEDVLELKTNKFDHEVFKGLPRICDLTVEHMAKKFVLRRKIPVKFHRELYYCEQYKTFVNNLIPNKIGGPDGPRLIIPFISYKNEVIGFTARALDDDPIRYSMILLNDGPPVVFGANFADFNKKYYVVEGPIDSMFLENAIAIGSSDLVAGLRRMDVNKENAVMIFDNEPRNLEIVGKMEKAINAGFSVVLWPSHLTQKDINDMILAGITPTDLMLLIDQHTYQGMRAKMAFVTWKKRSNNGSPKNSSNSSHQANSFGVP